MTKILYAIPALLISGSLFAQTDTRLYGGIEYGASKLENEAQDTANTFVNAFGGRATVTQDSSISIGKLFLGYRVSEKAAVEFGYLMSGDASVRVAGVSRTNVAYTATGKVEFSGFEGSGVWFPMAAKYGDAGPFLKAGIHRSDLETGFSITGGGGAASQSEKFSGTGTLFGAGYDWKFSDQSFARFSATRYLRIGGESDTKGTVYSIGVGANF